jgi:hypothetical protein
MLCFGKKSELVLKRFATECFDILKTLICHAGQEFRNDAVTIGELGIPAGSRNVLSGTISPQENEYTKLPAEYWQEWEHGSLTWMLSRQVRGVISYALIIAWSTLWVEGRQNQSVIELSCCIAWLNNACSCGIYVLS